MKFVRPLYHFLGGVYFALILIAAVALFVIAGTFIESVTQSHRYAALITYDTPLFALLLWGFFVNILFAATRRWPFRLRHTPFLTTHIGLLMILAGVLVKHYYGLQGTMNLSEGAASHEVMETNTYAVSIDQKNGNRSYSYPLRKTIGGSWVSEIAGKEAPLSIRLAEFRPHCTEYLATWVKGSHAVIAGLKPMPMYAVTHEEENIPLAGCVRFHPPEGQIFHLYALKTDEMEKTLTKLYTQNARLLVSNRSSQEVVIDSPLDEIIKISPRLENGDLLTAELLIKFSTVEGFEQPTLAIAVGSKERIHIPLAGDQALLNLSGSDPLLGFLPISVDIVRPPLLAVIEDEFGDVYLVAFDRHGKVWAKAFRKGSLDSLVVYDDGFAGYTVRAELPFKSYAAGRKERGEALSYLLTLQLRQAVADGTELSPPLQLLQRACQEKHVDFPTAATVFLAHCSASHCWLYPEDHPLPPLLEPVFSCLDWKEGYPQAKQACQWVRRLFAQLEPDLKHTDNLLEVLRKHNWPLLASLEADLSSNREESEKKISPYTLLTQQLFAASEILPNIHLSANGEEAKPEIQATLLSAYLRAYGIDLHSILPILSEEEMDALIRRYHAEAREPPLPEKDLVGPSFTLQTTVSSVQQAIPPGKKMEDNFPKITLFLNKEQRAQSLSLAYDRTATGLKWPVLDGEYLVRFQPLSKEIPYRLRLRQARQINYANSSQPYSYESDLIITDLRTASVVEKTISMNHVHETWDGYRFYLSSITQPSEASIKQIQIVVNHDPAKYWLTYPGAIVLSCGIFMLFVMRPYRRPKP